MDKEQRIYCRRVIKVIDKKLNHLRQHRREFGELLKQIADSDMIIDLKLERLKELRDSFISIDAKIDALVNISVQIDAME